VIIISGAGLAREIAARSAQISEFGPLIAEHWTSFHDNAALISLYPKRLRPLAAGAIPTIGAGELNLKHGELPSTMVCPMLLIRSSVLNFWVVQ
jgi:hypothetical protein